MEGQQKCSNCGQPRDPEDRFCKNCGKPFEAPPPPEPPPAGPSDQMGQSPLLSQTTSSSEEKHVPWEQREKYGFFGGLWETWKESVFYPNRFFSKLPFTGGLASPLLYALITSWFGYAVYYIYEIIFASFWLGLVSSLVKEPQIMSVMGLQGGLTILKLIIIPGMIVVSLFIMSGIYHLLFMLFGWAKRDFEATFRALAYSYGTALFMIVPLCGSVVGLVWYIVIAITGLKHAQQTTGGKAALVFFIPLILFCCCVAIMMALFWTAIIGMIGAASHFGVD